MPDQLQLPFALWTRRAVRDLITPRFGKTLGLSTVQLYLQRWGMTPQKPLARARERQPSAIAAWLAQHYPAIARRAKAAGAAIYWGDETGISNQDQIGRSYAPRGQTPVIRRTAKRITQSMISAVSNRGLMRFMFYEGALNADRFTAFLRRLGKDAGQKVFLIVDNLKVHHAAKVKTWVAAHAHEIELFYLPAYAPDHNPDEYLNNDLKQNSGSSPSPAPKTSCSRTPAPSCAPSSAHLAASRPTSSRRPSATRPECRVYRWDISSIHAKPSRGQAEEARGPAGRAQACGDVAIREGPAGRLRPINAGRLTSAAAPTISRVLCAVVRAVPP